MFTGAIGYGRGSNTRLALLLISEFTGAIGYGRGSQTWARISILPLKAWSPRLYRRHSQIPYHRALKENPPVCVVSTD